MAGAAGMDLSHDLIVIALDKQYEYRAMCRLATMPLKK